jgi:hypothetical protein
MIVVRTCSVLIEARLNSTASMPACSSHSSSASSTCDHARNMAENYTSRRYIYRSGHALPEVRYINTEAMQLSLQETVQDQAEIRSKHYGLHTTFNHKSRSIFRRARPTSHHMRPSKSVPCNNPCLITNQTTVTLSVVIHN